ncbi:hypothetical protein MPLSOD_520001 [Mesorhizobium sp. SOD10]|nr:hypothetical protein MPLSOD_520001 [Mesorhizobium sp. SOD10]
MRIRSKRGHQVAAVAVARKLAVWHLLTKEQDYFWVRPALVATKQRQLALKAGAPNERGVGRRGSAYAYNVKELRNSEKAAAENAERAWSGTGGREGRGGARTPQRRNDYKGCVAALSSSRAAGTEKRAHQRRTKKRMSRRQTCRCHPWCR